MKQKLKPYKELGVSDHTYPNMTAVEIEGQNTVLVMQRGQVIARFHPSEDPLKRKLRIKVDKPLADVIMPEYLDRYTGEIVITGIHDCHVAETVSRFEYGAPDKAGEPMKAMRISLIYFDRIHGWKQHDPSSGRIWDPIF